MLRLPLLLLALLLVFVPGWAQTAAVAAPPDAGAAPAAALSHGTSGKVYVQFVVDEEGHLLDPRVVKGLGFGLDEEALRLVRIMPWWNPGRIGGRPVRVAYTLPIVFRALD
jgi:TonB family protein